MLRRPSSDTRLILGATCALSVLGAMAGAFPIVDAIASIVFIVLLSGAIAGAVALAVRRERRIRRRLAAIQPFPAAPAATGAPVNQLEVTR